MICVRFHRRKAARKSPMRLALTRKSLLAFLPVLLLAAPAAWAASGDPTPPPDEPLILIAPIGLEAVAVSNQVIRDNVISDIGNTRSTLLDASFTATRGIGQLNQDAGGASNQANMLLLTLGAGAGNVFQDVNIYAAQVITGNTLTLEGGRRTNAIQNSFNNAQGYFQVNQNSGNLNAQANIGVVSVGVGLGNAFAILNDASLGGVVSNNTYNTNNTTPKSDVINGGFDGFRGAAQITQSSGDGNAVTNALAISVTVITVK